MCGTVLFQSNNHPRIRHLRPVCGEMHLCLWLRGPWRKNILWKSSLRLCFIFSFIFARVAFLVITQDTFIYKVYSNNKVFPRASALQGVSISYTRLFCCVSVRLTTSYCIYIASRTEKQESCVTLHNTARDLCFGHGDAFMVDASALFNLRLNSSTELSIACCSIYASYLIMHHS